MRSPLARAALIALLAAPAAPAVLAQNTSFDPFGSELQQQAGAKIRQTLDQMQQEWVLADPISGSLELLAQEVASMPGSAELRSRLASHVEALAERAAQQFIEAQDLANLQRRIVASFIDEALAQLREQAVLGKWSSDQAAAVIASWTGQARAFVNAPDPAAYRAEFLQGVEVAAMGAASAAEMIFELRMMLLQGQLQEAQQELQQQVEEGLASRSDYLRIYNLLAHRAQLISAEGIGQ